MLKAQVKWAAVTQASGQVGGHAAYSPPSSSLFQLLWDNCFSAASTQNLLDRDTQRVAASPC